LTNRGLSSFWEKSEREPIVGSGRGANSIDTRNRRKLGKVVKGKDTIERGRWGLMKEEGGGRNSAKRKVEETVVRDT
jgi:hypothetical protein